MNAVYLILSCSTIFNSTLIIIICTYYLPIAIDMLFTSGHIQRVPSGMHEKSNAFYPKTWELDLFSTTLLLLLLYMQRLKWHYHKNAAGPQGHCRKSNVTYHMSAVTTTVTAGTIMFGHHWKTPETSEFLSIDWTQCMTQQFRQTLKEHSRPMQRPLEMLNCQV